MKTTDREKLLKKLEKELLSVLEQLVPEVGEPALTMHEVVGALEKLKYELISRCNIILTDNAG